MTHLPGHVRQAFIDWAEDGFPETASIEENYEPKSIGADELLRMFVGCTDTMPRETCAEVAGYIGWTEESSGMTYAEGASALLVARASGTIAALAYLEKLAGKPA